MQSRRLFSSLLIPAPCHPSTPAAALFLIPKYAVRSLSLIHILRSLLRTPCVFGVQASQLVERRPLVKCRVNTLYAKREEARAKRRADRVLLVIWCRSAVNFSSLFLIAARRMRSNSFGTSFIRLCVRDVFCCSAFTQSTPFLHRLRCNSSTLFSGFAGITGLSDFLHPFHRRLVNFVLHGAFLCTIVIGKTQALPVLAHGVSVHARGLRPRGVGHALAFLAHARVAFRKR